MSSDEWTESGRDSSGVGRLGYDDTAPSEFFIESSYVSMINSAECREYFVCSICKYCDLEIGISCLVMMKARKSLKSGRVAQAPLLKVFHLMWFLKPRTSFDV